MAIFCLTPKEVKLSPVLAFLAVAWQPISPFTASDNVTSHKVQKMSPYPAFLAGLGVKCGLTKGVISGAVERGSSLGIQAYQVRGIEGISQALRSLHIRVYYQTQRKRLYDQHR